MSSFRMECIDNKMRDITKLADNYNEVKNIPSLLICNQNNSERINKRNLKQSVLLKNVNISCDINKNKNDELYKRNVPTGKNIPINIDMRPLPSSYCLDERFEEEQKSLEKYNNYVPEVKCEEDIFIPNRGTVKNYFDNIDVDSELKNINQIDTKCSKRLFKIDPNNEKTKLSCYTDTLIDNYNEIDCKNGYTWCNYNTCNKLAEFPVCNKKEFKCQIDKTEKKDIKLIEEEKIIKDNLRKIRLRRKEEEKQKKKDYLKTVELLNKKAELQIDRNIEKSDNPTLKPYEIIQYNNSNGPSPSSSEVSNIYAPIVHKRKFQYKNIEDIGYKRGLEKSIDKRIQENLDYYKKKEELKKQKEEIENNQYRLLNSYCPNMESIYTDRYYKASNSNIYDIDCRGQTRRLYSFNNSNNIGDCINCEQLFNNQTKRTAVNVHKIPHHLTTI